MSDWQIPKAMTLHSGNKANPQMKFPVLPDPKIGEIKSVYSSIGIRGEPKSLQTRILTSVGVGLFVVILMSVLAIYSFPDSDEKLQLILVSIPFGIGAGIWSFFSVKEKYWTSYVGTEGVQETTFENPKEAPRKEILYLFNETDTVWTRETDIYQKQMYSGTKFEYKWLDSNRKTHLKIDGRYNAHAKPGKEAEDNSFYFAAAAEEAFIAFKMPSRKKNSNPKAMLSFWSTNQTEFKLAMVSWFSILVRAKNMSKPKRSSL